VLCDSSNDREMPRNIKECTQRRSVENKKACSGRLMKKNKKRARGSSCGNKKAHSSKVYIYTSHKLVVSSKINCGYCAFEIITRKFSDNRHRDAKAPRVHVQCPATTSANTEKRLFLGFLFASFAAAPLTGLLALPRVSAGDAPPSIFALCHLRQSLAFCGGERGALLWCRAGGRR
jgi:hypothetical protein